MSKFMKNLSDLNLDVDVANKLTSDNVLTIDELWNLKRCDLKNMGFNNDEINHIIVKMQLEGIDLNKKSY